MAPADYPISDLPGPDPGYAPATVVGLQLAALRDNDDPRTDAGVLTAYNFASPANRRATGPRDRFVRMVHSPQYSPLIDHDEAVRGPVERDGNTATQTVTVTRDDRTVSYEFGLSLQATGPFPDCWQTDRVVVV
jgi:hypothetical protein